MIGDPPREALLDAYRAALDAVGGRNAVAHRLARGDCPAITHVAAIGKAAAAMAAGALDVLGDSVRSVLVVTRHGHAGGAPVNDPRVHVIESSHPVPDASSLAAGRALLAFFEDAPGDAAFLVLVSGGASALVEVLPEGADEAVLARVNEWLLASGLDIHRMNRVRKRVSLIKGGRLAAAARGRPLLALLISDVPGDDPKSIGSGPVVAHRSADIDISDLDLPEWLRRLTGRAPALPGPEVFASVRVEIVAGIATARAAAARALEARGFAVRVDDALLVGDALEAGRAVAADLIAAPAGALVRGGETTVVLPARPGRGGRCQSLALAAAIALAGRTDAWLLAAGTDGSDGSGDAAGALIDGDTLARGAAGGLDARDCLARADAGAFLAASGDLVDTGPTGTNVMDLVLGLRLSIGSTNAS